MKKLVFPLFTMTVFFSAMLTCPSPSFALLAEHLNYDGCNSCHSLHGSGGGYQLLAGVDTEATCLACHGSLTPVATEVAVHDPAGVGVGNQGYITCRECHGAHDNEVNNITLVGYDWDPVVDPSKSIVFANPTIRVELTTSDINSPVYQNVTFETRPDDFKRSDNAGVCEVCHNAGPTSGTTVLQDHEWGDCVVCHMHEDGFKKRQCVECHDINSTLSADAPKMVDKAGASAALVGSHLLVSSGDTIVGLTDRQWTVQCIACHTGHSGDVMIPNNTALGINYNATIIDGIGLGGSANVSGFTTEAEICWDCHDAEGVSEWGVNTDTNGAASNYDFGDIYTDASTTTLTSNWVGAWWESAVATFSYKTGQIQSTHAVSGNATAPGLDPVDEIRCSYCHDVHELALAPGDSASGKPYLRGSWKGSPYKEDGAPQAKAINGYTGNWYDYFDNNSSSFIFGSVPRGWGGSNGGRSPILPDNGYDNLARPSRPDAYWIDQNTNPNPTGTGTGNTSLGWTANNSAGLCALCHGDADGSWDTSGSPNEIDQVNHFGNSADDWIGTNGHSNAVLGGSGYYKANIFDLRGGNTGNSDNPAMAFYGANDPGDDWRDDYGFRNTGGAGFRPYLYGPSSWSGRDWYDYYIWGATIDNTTIDQQYHQFSCSKCHNPHASRLPRLMITNCLDTKHNTWDDDGDIPSGSGWSGDAEFGSVNLGRSISNWTSAQNCHRLGGVADGSGPEPEDCDDRGYNGCQSGDTRAQAGTGSGWNNVTPW